MINTRVSLLQRLRAAQDDGQSWKDLDDLYRPFILGFCLRRDPSLRDEADDLAQEVMAVVVRKLATFEWQQVGSFRAWLRAITWNVLKAHWDSRQRRPQPLPGGSALAQLEDPRSELSRLWDQEHNQHVVQRLLERIAPDFEPTTLRAFRRVVLDGRTPAETAAELGLSDNAVLLAKSRVLRRLREEGEEFLD